MSLSQGAAAAAGVCQMSKPILCIDFDGVVHSYASGWKGVDVILDPVVPGFFEWTRMASQFFELCIYSSRSKEPAGRKAMSRWLVDRFFEAYPGGSTKDSSSTPEGTITFMFPDGEHSELTISHSKPAAFLTIDDRAIRFEGNWAAAELSPEALLLFQPWNKSAKSNSGV